MFKDKSIEEVQKYWNSRPCNIKHSNAEFGTKKYFDETESRKYFVEPHIPGFANYNEWYGKKVLEIGCGIGIETINFARAGAIVTAVDYSEESLNIAKKRAETLRVDLWAGSIDFYHANAEELSKTVPIEKYDLIYSFGVIHHTPHPERVMSELKKYMGPDSVLKIMVYHRHSWKVLGMILADRTGGSVDELIARHSEAQTGCPVTYSYTRKSVLKLLEGFDVEDMFVDHIFPYKVDLYKQYIYKKVWWFRYLPKPLFRWLEQRLGWHLCVTATLAAPPPNIVPTVLIRKPRLGALAFS